MALAVAIAAVPAALVLAFTLAGSSETSPAVIATEAASASPSPSASPTPAPAKLTFVAHLPLNDSNGDVWSFGNYAYVGTWSSPCYGTGVKVIDVSDPVLPRQVGQLAAYDLTSTEDVMVASVDTSSFHGDLLAAGLQDCHVKDQPRGTSGLDLWDVSDPLHPKRLSFFDVAPSEGVHELYLFTRGDRVYVLLAVPLSEILDPAHRGDLRIVDVTDPRNPVQVSDWGAGRDLGLPFGSTRYTELGAPYDCTPPPDQAPLCRGAYPSVFLHSVSANQQGTRAYLAYWDAGMIILDISDPAHPVFLGRGSTPPQDDGDTHSAIVAPGDKLAITTDEDYSPRSDESPPGDTWGGARLWDVSDPSRPVQTGRITTANSLTNKRDRIYTAHNPELHVDLLWVSWYGDGVHVVDISDPRAPLEIASYVPPNADIWGVHVAGDLVYLSDIQGGLYVLRFSR